MVKLTVFQESKEIENELNFKFKSYALAIEFMYFCIENAVTKVSFYIEEEKGEEENGK